MFTRIWHCVRQRGNNSVQIIQGRASLKFQSCFYLNQQFYGKNVNRCIQLRLMPLQFKFFKNYHHFLTLHIGKMSPYCSLQVLGNGLLVGCTQAIIDPRNANPHSGVVPLPLALLVFAIILAFGYNTGCPINPGMDFAGRLFTAVAGWGTEPFT